MPRRRTLLITAFIAATAVLSTGCSNDAADTAAVVEETPAHPSPVQTVVEEVVEQGPARMAAPSSAQAASLSDAQMADLPRPVINQILPAGLPQVTPEDVQGLTAVPINHYTPGFANPTDESPAIVLESETDTVIEPIAGAWTVTGLAGEEGSGWVQVMVPAGRGALPSVDTSLVNHHAVWVPESLVTLHEENTVIEISVGDHLLRVVRDGEVVSEFHVGVGVVGESDTPTGLCSVIGHIKTQAGALGLLTNCQSDMMDVYAGVDWASFAIHQGAGFDPSTGGAVSNGCIRVPDQTFVDELSDIAIGTPVIITE